ncbi:hypothetical protein QBB34_47735 [Streptomyces stelliscabiei]|uniref:hypothetical protein n=1 Tax=Streptomyces stelliscabiei TaxID=146820 RepID=UPI002FF16346
MDPARSLPETLEHIEVLIQQRRLKRADVLNPQKLAAEAALPEGTVRALLRGDTVPADTVNDRVRARIKALSDAYLERTGKPMQDLASNFARQLGVSRVWARQVCSGEKMPSVELLHGLVAFFRVEGGEAFFTAPAPEAINRVLRPILSAQQPMEPEVVTDPLAETMGQFDDVRSLALRQAQKLPEERWKVLNATLKALLELDEAEGDQ